MKKIILFLAILLTSCVSIGTKIDPNKLSTFEKGKTTSSEVIAALGKPMVVGSTSEGGSFISYAFATASPDAASFIPFIGPLVGTTDSQSITVTFMFDHDKKLESFTQSIAAMTTGIFGVKQKNDLAQ